MTTYANPAHSKNLISPFEAGEIKLLPFSFDIANSTYGLPASGAIPVADLIQVGIVPAGCMLVPHLSHIECDAIAASAGAVLVGIVADDDELKGATTATSAISLFGEDFTARAVVGSKTADTPVYFAVSTEFTSRATTGLIKAHLAVRAWDASYDG